MFGVRDEAVDSETVNDTTNRILEIREGVEMPPERYGMFGGKHSVRSTRFHDTVHF
jgi:hypothetical protein